MTGTCLTRHHHVFLNLKNKPNYHKKTFQSVTVSRSISFPNFIRRFRKMKPNVSHDMVRRGNMRGPRDNPKVFVIAPRSQKEKRSAP